MRTPATIAVVALLAAHGAAAAPLNQNCVVSILNRTVTVEPDGTWVLPNVPANIGRVRARATCVEGGLTKSGQSAFFTVPRNGVVDVPAIDFDTPQPVPERLTATAPATTLGAAGATSQLRISALYPGGVTADVSAGATGTNYTISNPRIATVGANGLVTALASGTVLVTALNDGATALLRLSIVLSGDTDGDGIPDDVEIANGLDPKDPIDGREDYDGDGLTNRDEIARGTGLSDADSDDDGLLDGREVELGTEPLAWDTDGDGISDALEVQLGTDPLDPRSYDLSRALTAIRVQPYPVLIVRNSLLAEASRRLRVTGTLSDGRTIDLTSSDRGTQYTSTDLAVVSFGGVDGEIFAGIAGTAIVAVTNNGHVTSVPVTVRQFDPVQLSFTLIPGFSNAVDVAGGYAYVASTAGLFVVDLSDHASPRIVGSIGGWSAVDVRVKGSRAYVAVGNDGLRVVDVSNPGAPALVGALDTPGTALGVALSPSGDRVYVADYTGGLRIVSTDPLQELGSYPSAASRGVDVVGTTAVIADVSHLVIVDVSAASAPALLGSVGMEGALAVTVDGTLAYVANGGSSLAIVDFSDPRAPRRTSGPLDINTAGMLADVAKRGPFTFGADYYFYNGVPIMDVTDPANPTWRTTLNFRPRDDNGTGIAVDDRYVYLTGNSGNGGLTIGQYLEITDDAGVPPIVTVTSPPGGTTRMEGSSLHVTADAADDVVVASVTFLVDGVPTVADTSAPYEADITLPTDVTSASISAMATDLGGNSGLSGAVTVNLTPDPPPSVTLLAPPEGVSIMEGSSVRLEATASDNVLVTRVRFLVNGQEVVSRSAPPYVEWYPVPSSGAPAVLTIAAEATDNLGRKTVVAHDHPLGPAILAEPQPLAVPPDHVARTFTIRLSRGDGNPHTIALSSGAPGIATVSPPSVTIPAGQTAASATLTGVSAGQATLTLSDPTLGTAQVPVFVTGEFVGLNTSHALPVGVVLPRPPNPPSPASVDPITAPALGVVLGRALLDVAPHALAIGAVDVPLVLTGSGFDAQTSVSIQPPNGLTLGAPVASADGTTLTVLAGVAASADTTLREITVRDGSGHAFAPATTNANHVLIVRPVPEVTSVDPLFVTAGTVKQSFRIRGRNLAEATAILLTPGDGIVVGGSPVISADGSEVLVDLSVAAAAPLGARLVRVSTPGGVSSDTPAPSNTLTVVSALQQSYSSIHAPVVGVVLQSAPQPPAPQSTALVSTPLGVMVGAVLTDLEPKAASIGTTLTLTIRGYGLQNVSDVSFTPLTGLSLGTPTPSADGRSVTVPLAIDADAPQVVRAVEAFEGTRTVPVVTGAAAQFLITAPLPALDSVDPVYVLVGAPPARLTIRGRNFQNLQQVRALPGDGITISNASVDADATEIQVLVAATSGATLGPRTIVVETAAGATDTTPAVGNRVTLTSATGATFGPVAAPALGVVIEPPPVPPTATAVGPIVSSPLGVVLQAAPQPPVASARTTQSAPLGAALGPVATSSLPAGAVRGTTLTLTITGSELQYVSAVTLVPATGIALGAIQKNPAGTEIYVPLTLAADAPAGWREVVLTGESGRISFAPPAAGRFYVGTALPTLDSIDPILGTTGTSATLVVRGHDLQEAIAITATPSAGMSLAFPITINADGTQLTIPLSIAGDAPLGPRVIRVVTPAGASSGLATPADTFTVYPP